ncbi:MULTISPECIES: SDR family NAD(P)-dependent oxidoreductase [unclassified Mesorhizobium]|uniref:SDR family NAD(P)-dependent oxidoreductase n=1 Tax=unclassified Mesorhizobium TaxID=325217 RepID=UPI000FD18C6F|nr:MULTISPECIES: SDR family NAD(P)-dependent oxidoreductase [unclassified Mesorhizobium]RUU83044.1 SDR family oxidoreductase [Mesorhizobium sp. M7A.F.Ca.MR.362.00.0.0]RWN26852.1 MAG: SDR family oxidoreductase [Mesorhizobium sp.]RWN92289.1 MAG: SDR family oxidoreductase [Mesorhizobium sp.]
MEENQVAPNFRLDGKRALITGAGRGLGLAAAHALAHFGAEVVLAARTLSEVEAAAANITRAGGRAEAIALDIRDVSAVSEAVSHSPAFHVLVNNAGMNRTNPFLDVTQADFDDIMGLNLRASFFVAQIVARRMVEQGVSGSIINMSSQMGHVGAATRSVYCASKWAMEGMTKATAIDLAPYKIRVNTVCPTFVETPLAQNFLKNEAFRAEVLSKIKLGRIGHVDDITGAVVFLASDASSLMTGSSMIIDGGWTAD